jgi:hypothetical protein
MKWMWRVSQPMTAYLTVLRYLPEVTQVKSRKALLMTRFEPWASEIRTNQEYENLKC